MMPLPGDNYFSTYSFDFFLTRSSMGGAKEEVGVDDH